MEKTEEGASLTSGRRHGAGRAWLRRGAPSRGVAEAEAEAEGAGLEGEQLVHLAKACEPVWVAKESNGKIFKWESALLAFCFRETTSIAVGRVG